MPGPFFYSGSFPDVCTVLSGYAVVRVLPDDQTVVCLINGAVAWQTELEPSDGNGVQWLSAAADPATDDVFVYAQQHARGDDRSYIVDESGATEVSERPWGLRAGKVQWEGSDLVLYLAESSTTYWRWVDPLGSPAPAPSAIGFDAGAQGLRYVSGTTPQWALTGVGNDFAEITIQGVRFRYYVTRDGLTVGQALDSFNDQMALAFDGGANVKAVVPVQTFDQYNVVPFGDGSGLYAACCRMAVSVSGGRVAVVTGPPWPGATIASGLPDSGSGVAGTPTSNTIRKVTRPVLPRSSPAKRTYPHVDAITIRGGAFDDKAPLPTSVRDAFAASQQSTRLLWDLQGQTVDRMRAMDAIIAANAGLVTKLRQQLVSVNDTAREALAVAGKITAREPSSPTAPTLPPDQVGGPPVYTPPTPLNLVDAIDPTTITWVGLNISAWPITAELTNISISASQVCLDYTGKNVWPTTPESSTPANPWVIANIGGTWYASTYEWFRVGQICKSLTASDFQNYVTGTSPLDTWTPALGEQVGFLVSSLARNGPQSPVSQRTQIVVTTWPY